MTASLAESATTSWRGVDLQLVLRTIRRDAAAPGGAIVLDVHVRPLIRLAWWGPVLMAIGLCLGVGTRVGRARGLAAVADVGDGGGPIRRLGE